jgi:hypothetical protein
MLFSLLPPSIATANTSGTTAGTTTTASPAAATTTTAAAATKLSSASKYEFHGWWYGESEQLYGDGWESGTGPVACCDDGYVEDETAAAATTTTTTGGGCSTATAAAGRDAWGDDGFASFLICMYVDRYPRSLLFTTFSVFLFVRSFGYVDVCRLFRSCALMQYLFKSLSLQDTIIEITYSGFRTWKIDE